jgi:hypothetical protein
MSLILFLLLTGTPAQAALADQAPPASQMRKARDPNVAVEQELCAARAAATVAAYDLFIARHPRHPLADVARNERALLDARARQSK